MQTCNLYPETTNAAGVQTTNKYRMTLFWYTKKELQYKWYKKLYFSFTKPLTYKKEITEKQEDNNSNTLP